MSVYTIIQDVRIKIESHLFVIKLYMLRAASLDFLHDAVASHVAAMWDISTYIADEILRNACQIIREL